MTTLLYLVLAVTPTAVLKGTVTRIIDGDTIVVLDAANVQHKVRLLGIDAPERGQPFGTKAKEQLSELVKGKAVRVGWKRRDRYGRILGDVYVGGVLANRVMLSTGHAWHYTRYDRRPSFAAAEAAAKNTKVGIWSQPNPVPPWEFRKP